MLRAPRSEHSALEVLQAVSSTGLALEHVARDLRDDSEVRVVYKGWLGLVSGGWGWWGLGGWDPLRWGGWALANASSCWPVACEEGKGWQQLAGCFSFCCNGAAKTKAGQRRISLPHVKPAWPAHRFRCLCLVFESRAEQVARNSHMCHSLPSL